MPDKDYPDGLYLVSQPGGETLAVAAAGRTPSP
jgi:hypothetical protein